MFKFPDYGKWGKSNGYGVVPKCPEDRREPPEGADLGQLMEDYSFQDWLIEEARYYHAGDPTSLQLIDDIDQIIEHLNTIGGNKHFWYAKAAKIADKIWDRYIEKICEGD